MLNKLNSKRRSQIAVEHLLTYGIMILAGMGLITLLFTSDVLDILPEDKMVLESTLEIKDYKVVSKTVLLKFFNPTPDNYNISSIRAEYKGVECTSDTETNLSRGDEAVILMVCDRSLGDPDDKVEMNLTMIYGFSDSKRIYNSYGEMITRIQGGAY